MSRSTLVGTISKSVCNRVVTEIMLLQLQAGQLSLQGSAATTAAVFFSRGLCLLSASDCWSAQNRKTTMALYTGAAQAAYLCGDHEKTAELYKIVWNRDDVPLLQKKDIINTYLLSLGAQNKASDGLNESLIVLAKVR